MMDKYEDEGARRRRSRKTKTKGARRKRGGKTKMMDKDEDD